MYKNQVKKFAGKKPYKLLHHKLRKFFAKNKKYSGIEFTEEELGLIMEAVSIMYVRQTAIVPGDVLTDNGYHGEVVATHIYNDHFDGYYVADGVLASGLDITKFVKIADSEGQWKKCRGGVYFDRKILKEEMEEDENE